jgi:hypothetical protein
MQGASAILPTLSSLSPAQDRVGKIAVAATLRTASTWARAPVVSLPQILAFGDWPAILARLLPSRGAIDSLSVTRFGMT